jgi:hypothetical protein
VPLGGVTVVQQIQVCAVLDEVLYISLQVIGIAARIEIPDNIVESQSSEICRAFGD